MKQKIIAFIRKNKLELDINIHNESLQLLLKNEIGQTSYIIRPEDPTLSEKKIEIFFIRKNTKNIGEIVFFHSVIVQITNNAHQKKPYLIPKDKMNKLMYLLNNSDIPRENLFLNPRDPALSNEKWDNLTIYNSQKVLGNKLEQRYKVIRSTIARLVKREVDLLSSNDSIFLLDVGSGPGNCLNVTYQRLLTQNNRRIQGVGTDTNVKNIEQAKINYKDEPYEFYVEDTKQLKEIIKKYKKEENAFVIITSSGSLTRHVINNTLEALKILQQAYREGYLVVASGETEILTSLKIIKKIGWHCEVQLIRTEDQKTFYVYILSHKLIPRPEIKRNNLDLSLNAEPLPVLEKFLASELEEIKSIELALAHITAEEINFLLAKLPNLTEIFISGHEAWRHELEPSARARKIKIQCNPADYIDDELPDSKRWELSKHSKNFKARIQTQFFSEPAKKAETQKDINLPIEMSKLVFL